jgi:formylglycine-generating enzyme required for sulfatase activity/serine/threonine protein kinase
MAIALEPVVKQLQTTGIIAPAKLADFLPPKATPKDGEELLRELVKRELLTKFQAQQLAANRGKSLILGNYTLLDKIGAGGMGQVFKAQHRRMDRLVAIKMLPPDMAKDPEAVARFQREVKAAAKLRHPNVMAADDADEANGVHFLVMEYVEGSDLSVLVREHGPLSVDLAIQCILQAARGLAYAHNQGIIHRDIKPANLLLDKKGTIKVLDMGLARIEGLSNEHLTATEQVMGTVDYMSPEQAASTHGVDARADIYSLGCTLWFLLTGGKMYEGETLMSRMLKHREAPIPSLCAACDDVDYALEVIYLRMVAKQPEDRFQSMNDVVREFENLQANSSGLSRLAANEDSALKAFFVQNPEPGTSVREGTRTKGLVSPPAAKPAKVEEPTVDYRDGGIGTDPKSENSVKPLPKPATSASKKPPGKPPLKFIAAGIAGLVAIVLAVIFIVRDKHGNELARAEAPAGATIEIQKKPAAAKVKQVAATPPPRAIAPFDSATAKKHQAAWAKYLGTQVETTNSIGMRLTLIPPGEFMMGSTPEQNAVGRKMGEADGLKPEDYYWQRLPEEMPIHRVALTKPLAMGATEVTIGQFRKFVDATKYITETEKLGGGYSHRDTATNKDVFDPKRTWSAPGYAVTDDSPVTQTTWNDAAAFCNWLSQQERRIPSYRADGKGSWLVADQADSYRLPTEAEWEYACRAGTTTQFWFGDDAALLPQYDWFKKNAGDKAQPVAAKQPNPFGLYDMHGNVREWCQDLYEGKWYERSPSDNPTGPTSGSFRVIRGGGWTYRASYSRSAFRYCRTPSYRYHYYGLRCVRTIDVPATPATVRPRSSLVPPATNKLTDVNAPAFQQWMKDVQALPAEKQIEAVSKKLQELNPGFDGKVSGAGGTGTPRIEGGIVTELGLITDNVTDISPVRAFNNLRLLQCYGSKINIGSLSDLSPLKGMDLIALSCFRTQVSDLSPLKDMPLTRLNCSSCGRIVDLSPLTGMRLVRLELSGTKVSDLSPLRNMSLTALDCHDTPVSNLSPLNDCKDLETVRITETKVTPAGVAALQKALPKCKIEWDDPAKPKTPEPAAAGTK